MKDKFLKFFFIAGDLWRCSWSKLIKALKEVHPNSSFMGLGSDLMRNEGMKIIHHINRLSIISFYEVIKHLQGF